MNILKGIHKPLLIAVAVLSSICALRAQTPPGSVPWGAAVNGLQISLSVYNLAQPQIKLGLRNVGTVALKVLLGIHCGTGQIGTSQVVLELINTYGNSIRFRGVVGSCAGGAAARVVTLAPGEESSVTLDIDYYRNLSAYIRNMCAICSLRAQLTGPESGLWWKGQVSSNQVEIRSPGVG